MWCSICPGMILADTTLFLLMARILAVYDIRPPLDKGGNPMVLEEHYTSGIFKSVSFMPESWKPDLSSVQWSRFNARSSQGQRRVYRFYQYDVGRGYDKADVRCLSVCMNHILSHFLSSVSRKVSTKNMVHQRQWWRDGPPSSGERLRSQSREHSWQPSQKRKGKRMLSTV
jgi:hypothetical protein